ncbi:MAG: PilW family protein [Moraxella sp.]|nr:PilW family protein [Moraxella sp.]
MKTSQKGFTLIELMISVVLGLLIVAAVTQVYIMAVRTASTQKASAGILDANVYGMQQVERSLRMAGLGLGDSSRLNSACSGILIANDLTSLTQCAQVTGTDATGTGTPNVSPVSRLPIALWTNAAGENSFTSSGATPQLTIQYRAPVNMLDCEGRLALGPRKVIGQNSSGSSEQQTDATGAPTGESQIDVDGQVIIERYFVRNNNGTLELRCDAGRYVTDWIRQEEDSVPADAAVGVNAGAADITAALDAINPVNMNDDGALIISGIDDFQLRFGVQTGDTLQYQTIAEYLANPSAATSNISVVKMGILAKGLVATQQSEVTDNPTYTLLGEDITMASGQPTNFIRRAYDSTTMLRNSRGD